MKILLDMDGVLVDFVAAAAKIHGKDPAKVTRWDIGKCWKISDRAFWQKLEGDMAFWVNLKRYPWFADLVSLAEFYDPEFHLATSPSKCEYSSAGKVSWIKKNMGRSFRRYMIGPSKWLMADQDTVLIDDSDKNIDAFRQRGGHGVLFPQPWNRFRGIEDRVAFVRGELARISGA